MVGAGICEFVDWHPKDELNAAPPVTRAVPLMKSRRDCEVFDFLVIVRPSAYWDACRHTGCFTRILEFDFKHFVLVGANRLHTLIGFDCIAVANFDRIDGITEHLGAPGVSLDANCVQN